MALFPTLCEHEHCSFTVFQLVCRLFIAAFYGVSGESHQVGPKVPHLEVCLQDSVVS